MIDIENITVKELRELASLASALTGKPCETQPLTQAASLCIVVVDKGFVLVGTTSVANGWVTVGPDCKVVRQWGTKEGLGELASNRPQSATKFDPVPTGARIPMHSLVLTIPCEPSKWKK